MSRYQYNRNSLENVEPNHKCKQCQNSFGSKPELYLHIKSQHPKIYKCKECEVEFQLTIDLEKHIY